MEPKVFIERQRFTQIWIWLLVLSIFALTVFGIYYQLILGIPFGNNPAPDNVMPFFLLIPLGLIVLLLLNCLHTSIDEKGIHYKYSPFHGKFRTIEFDKIEKVYTKKYRPIKDFGGWGIRIGMKKGYGMALNVNSNMGIQIELKTGKKILLGTQKPDEAQKIIDYYFNKK